MKTQVLLSLLILTGTLHAQQIQWQNDIGGNDLDQGYAACYTADGGVIIGSSSGSFVSGDKTEMCYGGYDFWFVKLDPTGDMQWQNVIGGNDVDLLYSIHQSSDGGYVAGGGSYSDSLFDKSENSWGSSDYWIMKIDHAGNLQWENTIGGIGFEEVRKIYESPDGGFLQVKAWQGTRC